jgi:Ca2+-binding EF-hand superfamily protein
VDYIRESDLYPLFSLFDKDHDGCMDFDDFLQFVLPYDDMKLRAKVSQRPTYTSASGQLPANVEFELSRLIEKEVHYHIKVEEEKKTLERQADFNTVACFTILDPRSFGFIDFDNLKNFMYKFSRDINTCTINAILRRLNNDEDFKINFEEFALNITPILQGFTEEGCISKKTPLNLPEDPQSDDVIINSKFLELLEHDGLAFNID